MAGKDGGDLLEEAGALRQVEPGLAVEEPIGGTIGRARDFLEADDVGIHAREEGQDFVVQPPGPGIEREDAHPSQPLR